MVMYLFITYLFNNIFPPNRSLKIFTDKVLVIFELIPHYLVKHGLNKQRITVSPYSTSGANTVLTSVQPPQDTVVTTSANMSAAYPGLTGFQSPTGFNYQQQSYMGYPADGKYTCTHTDQCPDLSGHRSDHQRQHECCLPGPDRVPEPTGFNYQQQSYMGYPADGKYTCTHTDHCPDLSGHSSDHHCLPGPDRVPEPHGLQLSTAVLHGLPC